MTPDRRTFLRQSAGALAGVALAPDLAALGPRRLAEPKSLGVVGLGRQGRAIIAELQKIEGAGIKAVCDTSAARLATGLERAPGAEGFADHRALLAARRDLDAVIVATPTHRHAAVVLDVLAAGKHCYCEAPLGHTAEEARAIAAAADASRRVFMTGFTARSNPVYQLARTFARTDAFRDVVSGRTHAHRKTSWRLPASAAADERAVNWRLDPEVSTGLAGEIGSHQLDVMLWFLDAMPVAVTGSGAVRFHRDGRTVADTVQAAVRWADGTVVTSAISLANSYGAQHEALHGTNGAFVLAGTHGWMFKEADAPTLGWEVYALRQQFHQDDGIILIADATKLAAQGQLRAGIGLPYPPLYYALADFLRSVTHPTVPVPCSAADGLRSTLLGIRMNEAVVRGGEVTIEG